MKVLKEITRSNIERCLHEINTGEHGLSGIILEMQGWNFMKTAAGVWCQRIYSTTPQQKPCIDPMRLESVGTHVIP